MKVTLIRHGKVKHNWKKNCSSAEYDEECRLYDLAPIEEMEGAAQEAAAKIYISNMARSYQTALQLYGERDFCKSELIKEVPLRSSFDTGLKLPTWFWNMLGRVQWFFGSKRQEESRTQTIERAEQFACGIIDENQDCVLVTHGFFMHTLISVMKKHGFKVGGTSAHYKNGEIVTLTL